MKRTEWMARLASLWLVCVLACMTWSLSCGDRENGEAEEQQEKPLYACGLGLQGPPVIEEYTLGVYETQDKHVGVWDVYPDDTVSYVVVGHQLILTGRPGKYRVRITVGEIVNGKVELKSCARVITITGSKKPAPPEINPRPTPPETNPRPKPPEGTEPKPNPAKALGRITFGNSGCTATPIWPRRPDGRWDIITAAHCMAGVGSRGVFYTQDGRKIPVRVTVHERSSDLAWLVTEEPVDHLEYAVLARSMPPAGTKVWHAGYGVDKPGNREEGTLVSPDAGNNQATYLISVSSGDSGGGIFRDDTGEWLGAVCCTRAKGVRATVWAGHALRAAALRPRNTDDHTESADDKEYQMPRAAEHPVGQ